MAVDIFILAVVVVAGVMGFMRGLLSQIGQIAGLVVGVLASRVFAPVLIDFFAESGDASAIAVLSAYGIVFLLGYGVTWMAARMIRLVVRVAQLGMVDRICGSVFKIFLWGMMLSLALNMVILIGGDDNTIHSKEHPWRAVVVNMAPAVLGYLTR